MQVVIHFLLDCRLGTAVAVMARIPLLECLTRHSYRESMEKSISTPEKDSDETEEEKSTDSVLCTADAQRPSKVSASGTATCEPTGDQETNEMTDSGGLRAALLDDDTPEFANPSCFNVTLLDWINVQDRPNDVESVVRKCFDSINRVSHRWMNRHVFSVMKMSSCIVVEKVFTEMFLSAWPTDHSALPGRLSWHNCQAR